MSEQINMKESGFWFKTLVLGADRDKLLEVRDAEEYDWSNLKVELNIDGVVVLAKDFEDVMSGYAERIRRNALDGYINSDSIDRFDGDVLIAAEELLAKRLGKVKDLLEKMEDYSSEFLEGVGE